MTRLRILSDLHLEVVPHPEGLRPAYPDFDVLVVAGDVWQGEVGRAMHTVARLADGKLAVFGSDGVLVGGLDAVAGDRPA